MYRWAVNTDNPHTWSSGEGPNNIPIQKLLCFEVKQNYIRLQWMEGKKGLEPVLFFFLKMFVTYLMMYWQCASFWQVCQHAHWCLPDKKGKKALVIKNHTEGLESLWGHWLQVFPYSRNSETCTCLRQYTQWYDCKQTGCQVNAKGGVHLRRSYHTCWQ